MIESPCPRLLQRGVVVLLLMFAASALAAQSGAGSGNENDTTFSKANRLLFMTDHLQGLNTPARLEYKFVHQDGDTADDDTDYTDHVDLQIDEGEQNGKHVRVDFLSGDRHRYMPDIDNARGNPVIMMFLQNDVTELARRTGGSWRYFQRRVKFALEDAATVSRARATYDGEPIDVERIELTPYAGEQDHRDDVAQALARRYTFLLSDAVPGGVLELRAQTPAADGRPAVSDRLTLDATATRTGMAQ